MGPPPPDQIDLARTFGFTPEELALNRAGRLSARQRQMVLYHSTGYLVRGVAALVLGVVLLAALVAGVERPWEWALFGAAVILLAGFALGLVIAAVRVARPAMQSATGPLTRAGTASRPAVQVGALALRVSYRRWKRLPPTLPGHYRVYYSTGRELLSVEEVVSC